MPMRSLSAAAPAAASHAGADSSSSLLVMTYNVLAQCYVKSSFFPYCTPSLLRWKNRSKALASAETFRALLVQPHVICLQEVDQYDAFWRDTMQSLGCSGIYAQKTAGKRDGVAIFWQTDALTLVAHETLSLDEPVGDESDCSADLLARTQRGSVGLMAHFEHETTITLAPQAFVVATTHLFWDPLQEDVKLLQSQRMVRPLQAFAAARALPIVFAGDFNSLPGSRVYDAITRSYGFQSAYAHYSEVPEGERSEPLFTNVNGATPGDGGEGSQVASFIGTLDYLFYQSTPAVPIEPVALLELMSLDDATRAVALPSALSPSDHLPLLCEFRLGAS